jgi:outer membrane protein assembly factor BamB
VSRVAKHSFLVTSVLIFLIICGTIQLVASAASLEDAWPMFHHDPAHTGYSSSSVPTGTPEVKWSVPFHDDRQSPIVTNGCVYTAGYLTCFNASNGRRIWQQDSFSEGAAVVEGCIYTNTGVYNATTGKLLLNYTEYDGINTPTVAGGVIYMTGFAINASTANLLWKDAALGGTTSSAVANGYVYFLSPSGIYALDALAGIRIWNFTAESIFTSTYDKSTPAVANGHVYANAYDGNLYCLDALTGQKIWSYPIAQSGVNHPPLAFGSPAVAYGNVYDGSPDGNIYAIDAKNGAKIWNYTIGYTVNSSPAVVGGVVFVTSGGQSIYTQNCGYLAGTINIYAFDALTGTKLWNYTFPPSTPLYSSYVVQSSPAVVNGTIYVASGEALYALNILEPVPTPTVSPTPVPSSPMSTPTTSQQITQSSEPQQIPFPIEYLYIIAIAVAVAAAIVVTILFNRRKQKVRFVNSA